MEGTDFFDALTFSIGPVVMTKSFLTSVFVSALIVFIFLMTRHSLARLPGSLQTVVEGLYTTGFQSVERLLPDHAPQVFPFIATLWIFVFTANMIGLIPGFSSPTADISVTSALALSVYCAVHWFGIRSDGLRTYLTYYLQPNPLLLPLHLMSEISRTIALAIRLFGNIMSLEMAAYLVLLVAGFLVPVPLLMLHIIEALIQAYLFGMLALIYIAGAVHIRQDLQQKDKSHE